MSRMRNAGQLLEKARNRVLAERLNPLHLTTLERSHELCRAVGWSSYAAAYAELRGVDLQALADQTARFLDATEVPYAELLGRRLEELGLPALGELRRCDLPRFFRAPDLDAQYPADRLLESFRSTLAGLGIDLDDRTTCTSTPRRGGRSRRGHSVRCLACPMRCTW